nr:TraY domain-containing protein [Escherichia coli]
MVKLKLPVDVESLLIEASNRSGRSRSFEAVIRLKDHLHRYPKFKEGANKQVISSQADSLIKIPRIWADFFPANTSNQPI